VRLTIDIEYPDDLSSLSEEALSELSMFIAGEDNKLRSLHIEVISQGLRKRNARQLSRSDSMSIVRPTVVKRRKVEEELPTMEEFLRG
jgi:hypothetical protein